VLRMVGVNKKPNVKNDIIRVLSKHPGGLTTQNLSEMIGVSRNTVIRYASELKGEEVIYIRREGPLTLHYLKSLMEKFGKGFRPINSEESELQGSLVKKSG